MTISDSCFTLFEAIAQFQRDIIHYTTPDDPFCYSESLKQRLALIQADLDAVRAELDHPPIDAPAPRFDPITPRLEYAKERLLAWGMDLLADHVSRLQGHLEDTGINIWEDPKADNHE